MSKNHISQEYFDRLAWDYGIRQAIDINEDWREAAMPLQPGEVMPYVRLGEETAKVDSKPILFVHGYTAGIVANAPFGAAMAAREFDTIIPDQNRVGIVRNSDGKRDATSGQAMNMAAIIEAEGLQDTGLDVVTHSYGSLILEDLSKYAKRAGWSCFENSKVAMLAPAGIKEDESYPKFLKRYLALLQAGKKMEKFPDSYWAQADEMFVAGKGYFMSNKLRSILEGRDIIRRRVSLAGFINRGITKIALITFAEDALYTQLGLEASIGHLVSSKVVSFSPVSLEAHPAGIRSGRGADHSDQQFNPERVANAVERFLRPEPTDV